MTLWCLEVVPVVYARMKNELHDELKVLRFVMSDILAYVRVYIQIHSWCSPKCILQTTIRYSKWTSSAWNMKWYETTCKKSKIMIVKKVAIITGVQIFDVLSEDITNCNLNYR